MGVPGRWSHLLGNMTERLTEIFILAFFTTSEAWYIDPSNFRTSSLSVLGPLSVGSKQHKQKEHGILAIALLIWSK